MQVNVVAVLHTKPGFASRVIKAFEEVSPLVHNESGCELYVAHLKQGGDAVVMVERWSSLEDLQAHASGDSVKKLNELTAGLLTKPYDVWLLDTVALGDSVKGQI